MSWLSNILHGKNPMTRGADQPMFKPPANGPGTPGYTGPTNGFQYQEVGTHTTNNPVQTGVQMPNTNVNADSGDGNGFSVGDAGRWIWDNKENIFKFVVGAGAAYEGYKNSQKSNELMDKGLDLAMQDYNSRARYRDAAGGMLLDPQTPDLAGLFAAGAGNPYASQSTIPVVGSRAPAPPPPTNANGVYTGFALSNAGHVTPDTNNNPGPRAPTQTSGNIRKVGSRA